jgi:hypothetical protein
MNATGIGPMLAVSTDISPGSMTPWAAQRGQSGDDRGDLESPDQARIDEAQGDAADQDDADPEQDLGEGSLVADQERGDDHPEADHAADRQIEIPDQDRVGLGHRGHDQGERQDQDLLDVVGVDEAREP